MSKQIVSLDTSILALDTTHLAVVDHVPTKAEVKAERRHLRRVSARRFARLEQRTNAKKQIDPLPQPGETLHGCMDGNYAGWAIAEAIFDLLDAPIEEIVIATLGFNRQNFDSMIERFDAGQIKKIVLNVSNYFRHSDKRIYLDIKRELENRGQLIAVTRSHAKLILFASGDRRLVLESSANLRSSQNWEQFSLYDDAQVYDFHKQWILELCHEANTPSR